MLVAPAHHGPRTPTDKHTPLLYNTYGATGSDARVPAPPETHPAGRHVHARQRDAAPAPRRLLHTPPGVLVLRRRAAARSRCRRPCPPRHAAVANRCRRDGWRATVATWVAAGTASSGSSSFGDGGLRRGAVDRLDATAVPVGAAGGLLRRLQRRSRARCCRQLHRRLARRQVRRGLPRRLARGAGRRLARRLARRLLGRLATAAGPSVAGTAGPGGVPLCDGCRVGSAVFCDVGWRRGWAVGCRVGLPRRLARRGLARRAGRGLPRRLRTPTPPRAHVQVIT